MLAVDIPAGFLAVSEYCPSSVRDMLVIFNDNLSMLNDTLLSISSDNCKSLKSQ